MSLNINSCCFNRHRRAPRLDQFLMQEPQQIPKFLSKSPLRNVQPRYGRSDTPSEFPWKLGWFRVFLDALSWIRHETFTFGLFTAGSPHSNVFREDENRHAMCRRDTDAQTLPGVFLQNLAQWRHLWVPQREIQSLGPICDILGRFHHVLLNPDQQVYHDLWRCVIDRIRPGIDSKSFLFARELLLVDWIPCLTGNTEHRWLFNDPMQIMLGTFRTRISKWRGYFSIRGFPTVFDGFESWNR